MSHARGVRPVWHKAWALPLALSVQVLQTTAPVSMWHGGPRHPAFWRFVGVSVDGIGFGVLGACSCMFTSSHKGFMAVGASGGFGGEAWCRWGRARAAGADTYWAS